MTGVLQLASTYGTLLRVSVAEMIQYRASGIIWMLGMILEPVIYLVVWSTVATSQGGEVGGLDARGFAAYYLAFFVINHATFTWIIEVFQYRVQNGSLSFELLRPIHPIHWDIAENVAYKVVMVIVLVPAVVAVWWLFEPRFDPPLWSVLAMLVAIPLAFLARFFLEWTLGLAAFWTTRVSAINRTYYGAYLFLSGRVAPLDLLPEPLAEVAAFLPFYAFVGFPVDLALGRLSVDQAGAGLANQVVWATLGLVTLAMVWRAAVKRFAAVGS